MEKINLKEFQEMNLQELSQRLKPPKQTNKCSTCQKDYEWGTGNRGKCAECWSKEDKEQKQKEIKERIERLQLKFNRECNLPDLFLRKTFKDFDKKLQPKVYELLFNYHHCPWDYNKPEEENKGCDDCLPKQTNSCTHHSILLLSPTVYGVGKTHLVAAFFNRQLQATNHVYLDKSGHISERRCPVYFITEPQLLSRIRATFNKDAEESEEDIYYSLTRKYEYLAIDDIGKVKPRDISFLQSVYYRIIDTFYTGEDHNLILTTNLDFKELEAHIGGATADRLVEMCGPNIVKMTGQSYRTKSK